MSGRLLSWDEGTPADSMWRFFDALPIERRDSVVSLGEGMTPLLASASMRNVWLKDETRNPSGSAKDRAMSVAVTKGVELNRRATIIASTGSAGLSAAAYSARARVPSVVLVPHDTPWHRLALMRRYGGHVIQVDGPYELLMEVLDHAREQLGFYDVSTYSAANACQAEGPKTIAYEIFMRLGRAPEAVIVPVGGGGTLAGVHQGFVDLVAAGSITGLPRIYAVQNSLFNALELALQRGLRTYEELVDLRLDDTVTVETTNLKHAVPPDGVHALAAIRSSGGGVVTVADREAVQAQERVARTEGLLVEVSSAVVFVGYERLVERGEVSRQDETVLLLTGSALRDAALIGREEDDRALDEAEVVARLEALVEAG